MPQTEDKTEDQTDPDEPFSRPPRTDRRRAGIASPSDNQLPLITALFIFAIVTPLTLTLGPLAINPTRLVILLTLVPCLFTLVSGKSGALIAADGFFLGFTLWFGVAMAYHHGAAQIERIGQNFLDAFGAYVLARATITNAERFRAMVTLMVLAAALVMPLALVESLTSRVFLNEVLDKLPFSHAIDPVQSPQRLGLFRAQGTFDHPILYGVVSSSLIILAVLVIRARLLALPLAIGGCLSLSSAALLQILLQGVLLGWHYVLRGIPGRWKLLLVLVVLAYLAVDLASNRSPVRVFISYATLNSGTGYHRLVIWEYGSQAVLGNPIFGIGLNDWVRPAWLHSGSVDNFWLLVAMWCGFPGIILLGGGVLALLGRALRAPIPPGSVQDRYRLAWCLTIVTLCVALSTVHVWNTAYSYVFFLLGAGAWLANIPEEGEAAPPDRRKGRLPYARSGQGARYTRFGRGGEMPLGDTQGAEGDTAQPQGKRITLRYTRFEGAHPKPLARFRKSDRDEG